MRRKFSVLLLLVPIVAASATPTLEGRWEGPIQIPGRPLPIVLDLAQDAAGIWAGSIIVQGLGVSGAPLSNVAATGTTVAFDMGPVLASPSGEPARFQAHLTADADLAGRMRQGGNVAAFVLHRTSLAQVEPSPHSTAIASDLHGPWTGDYELGGYPRHVTISFENHPGAAATAQFVVIGKQTTNLPVDLVAQEGDLLHVESRASNVTFEGRYFREPGEIRGTIDLGSFELPLVLRRAPGQAS